MADEHAATVRTTPAEKRALARRLRDADTHRAYAACNTLTGPLTTPTGPHLPAVLVNTTGKWGPVGVVMGPVRVLQAA